MARIQYVSQQLLSTRILHSSKNVCVTSQLSQINNSNFVQLEIIETGSCLPKRSLCIIFARDAP